MMTGALDASQLLWTHLGSDYFLTIYARHPRPEWIVSRHLRVLWSAAIHHDHRYDDVRLRDASCSCRCDHRQTCCICFFYRDHPWSPSADSNHRNDGGLHPFDSFFPRDLTQKVPVDHDLLGISVLYRLDLVARSQLFHLLKIVPNLSSTMNFWSNPGE
jgi:hypothetical protein